MAATIEVQRRCFDVDEYHAMAEAGLREVWLIDLAESHVVLHHTPSASGYDEVERLGLDDTISPQALPELAIPINKIL